MQYIQLFTGKTLTYEIDNFKNDFKADEVVSYLPSDWTVASPTPDTLILWHGSNVTPESATEYLDSIISENFEWDYTFSSVTVSKVSEGGTLLETMGNMSTGTVDKTKTIDYLKSIEQRELIKLSEQSNGRGDSKLGISILQSEWDNRFDIIGNFFLWLNDNIDKTVVEDDETTA